MNAKKPGDVWAPGPEDLAAYLDGELEPGRHREVEAWLALHPETASDLRAQRRLTELWRATTPHQPSDAQWAKVSARLETSALAGRWPRPAWRRPAFPFALAVIGTAAALFVGFTLLRWHKPPEGYPSDDTRFRLAAPERGEMVQARSPEHLSFVTEERPSPDTLKVNRRTLRPAPSNWPKPSPPAAKAP